MNSKVKINKHKISWNNIINSNQNKSILKQKIKNELNLRIASILLLFVIIFSSLSLQLNKKWDAPESAKKLKNPVTVSDESLVAGKHCMLSNVNHAMETAAGVMVLKPQILMRLAKTLQKKILKAKLMERYTGKLLKAEIQCLHSKQNFQMINVGMLSITSEHLQKNK